MDVYVVLKCGDWDSSEVAAAKFTLEEAVAFVRAEKKERWRHEYYCEYYIYKVNTHTNESREIDKSIWGIV